VKKRGLWLVGLTLALLVSLAVGAAADSTFDAVKKRGTLIAGVKFDAPPFGFVDENGKNVGFDIDIARYIAERLNVKLELKQVTSKTRIPMLQDGQVDMAICTMTHQRQRDEAIDFSITYFMDGQKLLVKKGSGVKSVKDLAGKAAATAQGSTSEGNIKRAQPTARVVTFQEYPQAFLALQQGKVQAVTTDSTILLGLKAGNPEYEIVGKAFSSEPYAIGMRENDSKWRDAINFALQDMWRDGTYRKVYEKWFGPGSKYELESDWEIELWP
jgi:polar amino acid transport system substrate-binding protein